MLHPSGAGCQGATERPLRVAVGPWGRVRGDRGLGAILGRLGAIACTHRSRILLARTHRSSKEGQQRIPRAHQAHRPAQPRHACQATPIHTSPHLAQPRLPSHAGPGQAGPSQAGTSLACLARPSRTKPVQTKPDPACLTAPGHDPPRRQLRSRHGVAGRARARAAAFAQASRPARPASPAPAVLRRGLAILDLLLRLSDGIRHEHELGQMGVSTLP